MFFKKKKSEAIKIDKLVGNYFNAIDTDILVYKEKDFSLLFANTSANNHLQELKEKDSDCQNHNHVFPSLKDFYDKLSDKEDITHSFSLQDCEDRFYSGKFNKVKWLDDTPALLFVLHDVHDAHTATQRLYNLAYIDYLTGIPNRQKLREDFEEIYPDIKNDKAEGFMAIFDMDNFKNVNDTYGHNTGDIMLQRLTDHLSDIQDFKGHLYRLGGDEFVILHSHSAGLFETTENAHAHYSQMLQSAFMAYTMPNIKLVCTISMGVAFFPEHGITFSELLRKSDIALYKAKSGGRNQLALFEDRYDSAKKFKDLYISIQPVLSYKGETYGYELIDSGNDGNLDIKSIALSDYDRTMDALGLDAIEDNVRYFIAFSNQLLSTSVRRYLPKDKFIVEIRLSGMPTPDEFKKYKKLLSYGYSLALSNLNKKNMLDELLKLAKYIKFDKASMSEVAKRIVISQNPNKQFIATDIDTSIQFEQAQQLGFQLFQGFYFNQPSELKKTKDIDPLKTNYYRLLQLTSTEAYVDFREISEVISSDVALSYKLLRLLNSAALGLRNQISSIDMAVAFLGEESLKKWISMLALRGVAEDKPLELVRISLIRARFGELLAPYFAPKRNPKHVFLTGMFSLLHIALEKSKEELLEEISVADDIKESLLSKNGVYSDMLDFYTNYEYANWEEVSRFGKEHGLSDQLINDSYLAGVKWYNEISSS